MATCHIGSTNFYYETHGQGAPLVLIAGYSCDHTFWAAMVPELAKHFQVVVFDNRGMGQTNDPGQDLSIESMAEDTINVIKALELYKPIIVGQSMGGLIAQCVARNYAKNMSKLIILNASAKLSVRTLMALQTLLNLLKENANINAVIDASLPWFFSENFLADPHNIFSYKALLLQNPFPPSIQILERQLNALLSFNSHSWLVEIKTPTLVVAAEEDIICLPKESEQLAKGIPGAQLIRINSAHSCPIEKPAQLNQAILSFVNNI